MVLMETGRNDRYHSDVAVFFEGPLDSVSRAEPRLYTLQYAFAGFTQALNGVMRPLEGRIVRGESSDKVSPGQIRALNAPAKHVRTGGAKNARVAAPTITSFECDVNDSCRGGAVLTQPRRTRRPRILREEVDIQPDVLFIGE